MIIRLAERELQTLFGPFKEILYYDGQKQIIALVMGNVTGSRDVLCRIHSECISAQILNSIECDCREQMMLAQKLIMEERKGIVIYLEQEGRDNGHLAYMKSARMAQEENINQTAAYQRLGFMSDARDYSRAADILRDLQIVSTILLSNNPDKSNKLSASGIQISAIRPLVIDTKANKWLKNSYVDKRSLGHNIPNEGIFSY